MIALDIPMYIPPPMGSILIFELHTIENRTIVRSFYFNETTDISRPIRGHQVLLSWCQSYDCPFDVFRSRVANLSANDIQTECAIPDSYRIHNVMQDYTGYPTLKSAAPDGLPLP